MLRSLEIPTLLSRFWQARANEIVSYRVPGSLSEGSFSIMELAHEIKNPLSVILATTGSLSRGRSWSEQARSELDLVEGAAVRINKTVNSLLENHKFASGEQEVCMERIRVTEFLKQIVDEENILVRQKMLGFSVTREDTVPDYIWIDSYLVRRVLDNLLSNARKCTVSGEISLRISSDSTGGMINFDVTDTGCGMTLKQRTKVFHRYHQAGDRDQQRRGNGLGLYVCQKLARSMSGELILLDSSPGKGSTFRLTIPIASNSDSRFADDARRHNEPVLVVDDDPAMLAAITHILSAEYPGAIVHTAYDVHTAEKMISSVRIGLLLTDYNLPDGTGLDIIQNLRRLGSLAEVVLMSGESAGELRKKLQRSELHNDFFCIDKTDLFKELKSSEFRKKILLRDVRSVPAESSNLRKPELSDTRRETKMTRISPVDTISASNETIAVLEKVKSAMGGVPNLIATMAHSPSVVAAYLAFNQSLSKGKLSPILREKIALAVGHTNQCEYCVAAHTALAGKQGISIADIEMARRSDSGDKREVEALRFAKKVVTNRGRIESKDLDALRGVEFTEEEICEITAHIALNIFTNYFNHIAGTEVDFPKVRSFEEVGALA